MRWQLIDRANPIASKPNFKPLFFRSCRKIYKLIKRKNNPAFDKVLHSPDRKMEVVALQVLVGLIDGLSALVENPPVFKGEIQSQKLRGCCTFRDSLIGKNLFLVHEEHSDSLPQLVAKVAEGHQV